MAGWVQVIGCDAAAARFTRAIGLMQDATPVWLQESGELLEAAIQARIADEGLVRTGDLWSSGRSFGLTMRSINTGFGRGLDYAAALERGAGPHEIAPKTAGALTFWWEREARMFYGAPGQAVSHPGNRPYAFMVGGTEWAFPEIVANRISNLIAALAKA